jgi:outer membrane protein OmpA-like peptidoglycan-associated protein
MRMSSLSAAAFAAVLFAAPFAVSAPAAAGPAYTADDVVNVFGKGKTRSLCFRKDDPACQPPKMDLLVTFEFNSDQLTQAAKDNLAQFAKAMKDPRLNGTKFEIDGHTDATGAEQYNLGLSERRASSAVAFLESLGVTAEDLKAKGFGKSKPRVADPFSAENRRVEAHLLDQ